MKNSSYPHGFSNGVDIKEIPIESPANKANVFWVDSTVGSNGNKGNRAYPFATLAYAITRCTASNGDFIYLAPGHVETVIAAGTVTLDKAGVTIVFLGEGTNRAKINFTTDVTASVVVSGNNISLVNPVFVSGIDALTAPITISGTNVKILNGAWLDAPAMAANHAIATTNAASYFLLDGWTFYPSTTGTQKQSNIVLGTAVNPLLKNIEIVGDFSVGNINAPSAITNLQLDTLKLKNSNATPKPGMVIHAGTTGMAKNIDIRIDSGTTYVSSVAALNWDNSCLGYNTDGYGGDPIGTGAAVGIEGQVAAVKAVTDLLPDAGALTSVLAMGTGIGTTLVIQKTLTSSAIIQAGVDVTAASSGGALMIEDIFMSTNATGLATGTNFTLETNNANGVVVFFAETVANLGANKTENVASGSVTGITGIVLETGKKIIAKSTVADCTGGGTITLTIKLRRVAAGATVAAA